ncbi:hypothetical protein [Hymenobacter sp. BT491]|uniref:hypothetical protein n=1 Tax=Hymenobacter sp. BT491 TaxID=2766779 RepID=UPI00165390A1|nr:hypothetical protein [Hymenobacter sp. BT491]MBC6988554.1 hypothetical protein [Hymenobacter sp. BT491]
MSDLSPYELRNLEQSIGDNLGGIEACWYVPVEQVQHIPDSDAPILFEDVQLRAGATWYQVVAVQDSIRYQQPGKNDRSGDWFQPKLTGVLAKNTSGLAAGLEAMQGHLYVVLYRDANGQVWLVGSLDEPLTWSEVLDAGSATSRNQTSFTFATDTTRRARAYFGYWVVSEHGVDGGLVLQQGQGGSIELRDRRGVLMATVPVGKTVIIRSGFRVAFTIQ